MSDNMSLRAKIMMCNGLTLLFLIILGAVSLSGIRELKATDEWVDHTYRVILKAKEIESAAVDMETGKRGFLLAGKEQFLEPYVDGRQRFNALVEELKLTVSDNPAQVTLLEEIKLTISEWQSEVTENAISLRRDIGDAKSMNDMAKLIAKAEGKTYFDRFRELINTFIARERALLEERRVVFSQSVQPTELRDAVSWVTHTHEVIEQALLIESAAVDMETGMRGFLLAGDEVFLEPYRNGNNQLSSLISSLKIRVSDNPSQVTLLNEIEKVILAWREDIAKSQIDLRREIGDSKTMDDVSDFVAAAEGKLYFDKFRGQIAEFIEREQQLMTQRIMASEQSVSFAYITIIGGIILAVFLSILSTFVLSRSITKPFREIFKGLKTFSSKELNQMSEAFLKIVHRMSQSSAHLSSVSCHIDDVSQKLSDLSNSQAAALEETSTNTEQISSVVNANTRAAEESRNASVKVADQMENLDMAMENIADSNQKISDLVKIIEEIGAKTEVINEIVFQTKLLSFNASVEAKRAGEHGRGFSVVAQEVGNLAELSGKAAKDITAIVEQSISEAEAIVRENGERVKHGSEIVLETRSQTQVVTDEATKIFNASNEQARGVEEIGCAIESINLATQRAATIAEQVSVSSSDLRKQANGLNKLVINLNGFLQGEESQDEETQSGHADEKTATYPVVVDIVPHIGKNRESSWNADMPDRRRKH